MASLHDIGRRTFASAPTTDVYVSCNGTGFGPGGYFRTLSIGSNWTKIRVGIQFAVRTDGTNNLTTTCLFAISCNSTDASCWPINDPNINSYFGLMLAGGDTFTYNAGGGNPYFMSTRTFTGKRIGATQTLNTQDSTDTYYPTNTGSTQRRGICYCDFDKSNGEVSLWSFTTASHVQVDYSEAVFLAELASSATPAPSGNTMAKTANPNIGVTDTGGALDTIGWYYSGSAVGIIEVYNIAVYRFV